MWAAGPRFAQAVVAAAVLFVSAPCVAQVPGRQSGQSSAQPAAQQSPQGTSRSITIYMLNGRTGKPMRHKLIRAQFPGSTHRVPIVIDNRGFGHLQIPPHTAAFTLHTARTGREKRPSYNACGPYHELIFVKDVLAHGYVPLDACSPTLKLSASPGVLLYFAEPRPWYPPSRE